MRRIGTFVVALFFVTTVAAPSFAADEDITFKKRGTEEKAFVTRVGEAVIKAAHGTAKKVSLLKYDYSQPKPGRTELSLKMEYHGAVTGKVYLADIVVKIDSSDKDNWEVMRIDYSDNNTIKHNERKIEELIRQLNK